MSEPCSKKKYLIAPQFLEIPQYWFKALRFWKIIDFPECSDITPLYYD